MQNNRRNQRNARKNTQKQTFFQEVMSITPRDYQERNWFYDMLARVVSYPLQFMSILAGSYLLYELGCKIFALPEYSTMAMVVFALSFAIFFGIEVLRRSLVYEVGHHYLATYSYETHGEWLRTKLIVLALISVLLITSGTFGAYQYSQNNAPQQEKIDIKQTTSPLLTSIQGEKNSIAQIDKTIAQLQNNKATELRDHKSYAIWEGKEYLLPETKTRHEGYDKQIATYQAQRKQHLDLLAKHEAKLDKTEDKTHSQNAQISEQNLLQKNSYSIVCAVIWLVFEALLLYCVAYEWIYKVGAKSYFFDKQGEGQDLLQEPLQGNTNSLQGALQEPSQGALQEPLQGALQDLFLSLAREKQQKQERLARKKQQKQEVLPDFQGLIKALQEGETRTNYLTNAYNVNFNHVNSARVFLGLNTKEPTANLSNTTEYAVVAKYLGVPIQEKTKQQNDLFAKGGAL